MSNAKNAKPVGIVLVSGAAIWAVAAASGLLNAWGWSSSATGLVALVLVTLVIGSEVLGITLALAVEHALGRKAVGRAVVAGLLLVGVGLFNAYSGHRALHMIEAERHAPFEAAQAARAAAAAEVARIEAELANVPALPVNVPAARLRAYIDARNAELARLEPQAAAARERLSALPTVEAPPPGIEPIVMKAIVVLIECLKVFGLWAVASGHSQPPAQTAPNAAADLANRRWAKRKEA